MGLHLLIIYFTLTLFCSGANVAIYKQDPIADSECAAALFNIFKTKHKTIYLTHNTLFLKNLNNVDCLVFPGGLGDVDAFDQLLFDKKDIVQKYFNSKKIYFGVCMGAYIAGKNYFNLVKDIKITQYIKQSSADVYTDNPTIVQCKWQHKAHIMYFFDGPVFLGKLKPKEIVAYYNNNKAAAIIKKNTGTFIGVGPHPESLSSWYNTSFLKPYWHNKEQHNLLLDLLDQALN